MGKLSAKLRSVAFNTEGTITGIGFWCPGCDGMHAVPTNGKNDVGAQWAWNGDVDRPTLTPSLMVRSDEWSPPVTSENLAEWKKAPWPQTKVPHICHTFITNGQIQFLSDCSHAMAGQTVDIPDFD